MTTCTKPAEKTPDRETVLAHVIEFAGFDNAECDVPAPIMRALHEAFIAYVRSRRDPDAARLVLLGHLPAMTEAFEEHLRGWIRTTISDHTASLRKLRAEPADKQRDWARLIREDEEYLRLAKAAHRWLYGA